MEEVLAPGALSTGNICFLLDTLRKYKKIGSISKLFYVYLGVFLTPGITILLIVPLGALL